MCILYRQAKAFPNKVVTQPCKECFKTPNNEKAKEQKQSSAQIEADVPRKQERVPPVISEDKNAFHKKSRNAVFSKDSKDLINVPS